MDNNTLYIMCECLTPPEDIRTDVLTESTVESASGKKIKTVTIDTCLQSFEVENWNGRIYGKNLVLDALNNDGMIQNDIKKGQWIGEYGHPLDTDPKRQVVFNPTTASHRILNYRTEGNLLLGHVQTLAGGAGDMLCDRILQGVPAAFSLRSLGSVDLATRRVKAPLKIITYDSVFRPSHIEAYQTEILSECASYVNLNESVDLFAPINESMEQIKSYISEKSDNVARAADFFGLDKLAMVLQENGTVTLIIDECTSCNVPIESVIGLQYADVLGSKKISKRSIV